MKIKRVGILIILLAVVCAGAVIYFSMNKSGGIPRIEVGPGDISYSYNGAYDSGNNYNNGYGMNLIETTLDTIIQNVQLSPNYQLSLEERFEIEKSTGKLAVNDWSLSEKLKVDPMFYVNETKVEGNRIVRTFQSVENKSSHTMALAEFWILDSSIKPETAISLLIKTNDSRLIESGACSVEKVIKEEWQTYDGDVYEIVFKSENIPQDLLSKYSNQSINNICGSYGPVKDYYGNVFSGRFLFNNDVLLHFPIESFWTDAYASYDLKIIKR